MSILGPIHQVQESKGIGEPRMWHDLRELVAENWMQWFGQNRSGSLRQYARSSAKILKMFFIRGDKGVVCLCARSSAGHDHISNELQSIDRVLARCSSAVSVTIPRPLGVIREFSSALVAAQTMLKGVPMIPSRSGTERRKHWTQVAELIGKLHGETAEQHFAWKEETFDRYVRNDWEQNSSLARIEDSGAWIRRTEEIVSEIGGDIPIVLAHRDLHPGNILVSRRGNVSGLVDWGESSQRNLPFFDWYYFLVSYLSRLTKLLDFDRPVDSLTAFLYEETPLGDDIRRATRSYCSLAGVDPRLAGPIFDLYALTHLPCVFKYCLNLGDDPGPLESCIVDESNIFRN